LVDPFISQGDFFKACDLEALTALDPAPQLPLPQDPAADVAALLDLAQQAHRAGRSAPWQQVLPLYASSPVAGA
jgi:hypothetical protein